MKVFVATRGMQGFRQNDFCFVPEGELVMFSVLECDGEAIDGRCGCKRAMSGLKCHSGTTTFKAVDMPDMDIEKLTKAINDSLVSAGWYKEGDPQLGRRATACALELMHMAEPFEPGMVVERRGNCLQSRGIKVNRNSR